MECDPEVDIDKAQAEEDANYFDEEDLGNLTSIQNSGNIFILRVLELFDFSAEQHFGTEARGRFFHRGNDFSQKKSFFHRGNEAQTGEEESVEKENQLLHRETVNLTKMMIVNIMIRTMLKYT